MKIYTRTGDGGGTALQGGRRVSKSDKRIAAYGSVDEVNSVLGVAASLGLGGGDVTAMIARLQGELLTAGADLSNPDMEKDGNRITAEMVERLEREIDALDSELRPLSNFILPGGDRGAAAIHLARTVARRAETQIAALAEDEEINPHCMAYFNRLSDLLFTVARAINSRRKIPDATWSQGQAGDAGPPGAVSRSRGPGNPDADA